MLRNASSFCLVALTAGSLLSCHKDKDCAPRPKPACYSGRVVAYTCMLGPLVDVDPAYPIGAPATSAIGSRFFGNNVIAVANPASLPRNGQLGQTIYFTSSTAATPASMMCLAADGTTTPVPIVTLSNVSTAACDSVPAK